MPAILLCGKRSLFAGDDLRGLFKVAIVFRFLQVVFALLLGARTLYDHVQDVHPIDATVDNCLESSSDRKSSIFQKTKMLLDGYILLSIILACGGLGLLLIGHHMAGLGTPTDVEARRKLPILMQMDIFVFGILRIGTLLLGIIVFTAATWLCTCTKVAGIDNEDDNVPSTTQNGTLVLRRENHLRALQVIQNFNGACEGYRSQWTVLLVGSEICQFIDVTLFALFFLILVLRHFPHSQSILYLETKWECCGRCLCGCLRILTCCRVGGGESCYSTDMAELAALVVQFFDDGGYLDVTFSDFLAGFYMVRLIHGYEDAKFRNLLVEWSRQQQAPVSDSSSASSTSDKRNNRLTSDSINEGNSKHTSERIRAAIEDGVDLPDNISSHMQAVAARRSSYHQAENVPMSNSILSVSLHAGDVTARALVAEGARFISYAQAIYTWSLANTEPCCATWLALPGDFSKQQSLPTVHFGREIEAAPIDHVSEEDIVYVQYKQGVVSSPYAIVLDHKWKSVVIAIRGTQSLEDMLADLMMVPVELTSIGVKCGFDGKGRYAHSGMVATCEWLYDDIAKHGTLDRLLVDEGSKYKSYHLRITGHSLGAGCAIVLTLMMRPKFPNARCVAFSPPGCTVSDDLAEDSCPWVTSFVLDSDIIPRSSIETFMGFHDEILDTLARIKVPKYRVMENRTLDHPSSKEEIDELEGFLQEALHELTDIPPSPFTANLQKFRDYRARKRAKRPENKIKLQIPGRIIHLIDSNKEISNDKEHKSDKQNGVLDLFTSCAARWEKRQNFDRIVLTSHMLKDHKTESIQSHLVSLAFKFDLKSPYCPGQRTDRIEQKRIITSIDVPPGNHEMEAME